MACVTSTLASKWEPAHAQFPPFNALCGVACVMANTSSVESVFSRLRFANIDNRSKLTCLAMEVTMQVGDIIAIARKIAVPIELPRW
jgi:hypothetical protein